MQKKISILLLIMYVLVSCTRFDDTKVPAVPSSQATSTASAAPAAQIDTIITEEVVNSEHNASNAPIVQRELKVNDVMQTQKMQPSPKAEDVAGSQPKSYRVEIGDSLYSIARKNNIGITCLAKINKITEPNRLSAGQFLVIPKSSDC